MPNLSTTLLSADQRRIYLLTPVTVRTHEGSGRLVYLTTDGYAGVRLADERRVDEYGVATIKAVVS